jgi:hypothetical protein
MWHAIKHFFGWQRGEVVTEWWRGDLWVGFQCAECGAVTGAHKVPDRLAYPDLDHRPRIEKSENESE